MMAMGVEKGKRTLDYFDGASKAIPSATRLRRDVQENLNFFPLFLIASNTSIEALFC
jgi:hypothetical protein